MKLWQTTLVIFRTKFYQERATCKLDWSWTFWMLDAIIIMQDTVEEYGLLSIIWVYGTTWWLGEFLVWNKDCKQFKLLYICSWKNMNRSLIQSFDYCNGCRCLGGIQFQPGQLEYIYIAANIQLPQRCVATCEFSQANGKTKWRRGYWTPGSPIGVDDTGFPMLKKKNSKTTRDGKANLKEIKKAARRSNRSYPRSSVVNERKRDKRLLNQPQTSNNEHRHPSITISEENSKRATLANKRLNNEHRSNTNRNRRNERKNSIPMLEKNLY